MKKKPVAKKSWDNTMKLLARANAQDFVSWLLKDGIFLSEANVEIKTDSQFADMMFNVKVHSQDIILHIEFQRRHDSRMSKRVWIYNISTCIHSDLPVYSAVIYLIKDSSIQEPTYEVRLPSGTIVHQFFFQNIKLWEISPEVILQQNLPGLLPLLPFTKGGHQRAIIEQMVSKMQNHDKSEDLLTFGLGIAALVLRGGPDEHWLKERFKKMQPMLEDSWVFQEIKQQGMLEGFEQGQQEGFEQGQQKGLEKGEIQALLDFVEIRFPTLLSTAKQVMEQPHSVASIQALRNQLYRAKTLKEARKVLQNG